MTEGTVSDSCRILRAIEGQGESQKSKDFVVQELRDESKPVGPCRVSQIFRSFGTYE
jgi:hypothetical protein